MKQINIIKFVGLKNLTNIQQKEVKDILNYQYEKIHRLIRNITNLIITIKVYDKQGKANKFSVHIRLESPTQQFTSNASDWDLNKTLHKAIGKVINEIQHTFKQKY